MLCPMRLPVELRHLLLFFEVSRSPLEECSRLVPCRLVLGPLRLLEELAEELELALLLGELVVELELLRLLELELRLLLELELALLLV